MILQRIIEQGKTAKKLGYDPKYCAYTMVDLHALMEQHALGKSLSVISESYSIIRRNLRLSLMQIALNRRHDHAPQA